MKPDLNTNLNAIITPRPMYVQHKRNIEHKENFLRSHEQIVEPCRFLKDVAKVYKLKTVHVNLLLN